MPDEDYRYPPPSRGNITWIYPWPGAFRDMMGLLLNKRLRTDEKILEKYFPAETVFTDSGRSAIRLALTGLGLGKGDEVILSDFNCPAVVEPVISSGATPVIVDCDDKGRIDPEAVKAAITPKTRVIILSNIYGMLDDKKAILSNVKGRNIVLIEDLCQTLILPEVHPEFFDAKSVYVFSFGQEKHVFCFGGGAVFSKNKIIMNKISSIKLATEAEGNTRKTAAARIKYFLTLFIHAKAKRLVGTAEKLGLVLKFEEYKSTGQNTFQKINVKKMNPAKKIILDRKLEDFCRYEGFNLKNFNYLRKQLVLNKNFELPGGECQNPLYFTIRVKGSRYELAEFLAQESVPTVWNYVPFHKQVRYKKYSRGKYPNAEKLWTKVLSIPFRHPMAESDLKYVVSALTKFDYGKN